MLAREVAWVGEWLGGCGVLEKMASREVYMPHGFCCVPSGALCAEDSGIVSIAGVLPCRHKERSHGSLVSSYTIRHAFRNSHVCSF